MTSGPTPPHRVYLPNVQGGSGVTAASTRETDERRLAQLIMAHPEQQRRAMQWDDALHLCARKRAEQIRNRGAWAVYGNNPHLDANGHGPNWWLCALGFDITGYSPYDDANNVESLALCHAAPSGLPDPPLDVVSVCLRDLLASPPHRAHILGENGFSEQTCIGVGITDDWNEVPQNQIISILIV